MFQVTGIKDMILHTKKKIELKYMFKKKTNRQHALHLALANFLDEKMCLDST